MQVVNTEAMYCIVEYGELNELQPSESDNERP